MRTMLWILGGVALSLGVGCGDDGSGGAGGNGGAGGEGGSPPPPAACDGLDLSGCDLSLGPTEDDTTTLQQAFIEGVDAGGTICLCPGEYAITAELSVDKPNLTVRGVGASRDDVVLDFLDQTDGDDGLTATSDGFVVEKLSVKNTPGNGIVVTGADGVVFRDLKVSWDAGSVTENGAYAVYPVSSKNVLVEDCEIVGAADAGVYVGQSENIIVRRNKVYANVAGIEIENSVNAEVHHNDAYRNTGGILVFDLPDLPVKKGGHCRVYQNRIHDNNLANFAPKGNIVGTVPQGTGILLLAANHVEVFQNEIRDNRTLGTCIASYHITEKRIRDSAYHPFPTAISIHDNTFSRKRVRATLRGRMGKLFRLKLRFGRDVPDILFDGILDPALAGANGSYPPAHRICIRNNANARFAALDAANGFRNISTDTSGYDCDITVNPDRKTGGRP